MAYIKALCDELEQNKQELESCNDSDIDKRLKLLNRQHELIEKILGFTNSEIEQYMSPSYLYQYQLQVETTIDTLSSSVTSGGAESMVEETPVETVEPENIQSEQELKSEDEKAEEKEESVEQSESKENVIETEFENNQPLFGFGGGAAGSEKEETPIESKADENVQELIAALESFASTEEIKPLIEKCDNVNAKDEYGWTPLMHAVVWGAPKEVVELLIKNKADVNATDKNGKTPLMLAKEYGVKTEIIELLQKAEEASIKPKVVEDKKAEEKPIESEVVEDKKAEKAPEADENVQELKKALESLASTEEIKPLIERCANINTTDKDGKTPLMYAVANKALKEVVELLIAKKADVNAKDNDGWTPLMYATRFGAPIDVVELLIKNKADVNAKDEYGWTPLMLAAEWGAPKDVVELLINKGADVKAKNNKGQTPLQCAKKQGASKEIINLLKKAEKESVKPKATVSDKYYGLNKEDIKIDDVYVRYNSRLSSFQLTNEMVNGLKTQIPNDEMRNAFLDLVKRHFALTDDSVSANDALKQCLSKCSAKDGAVLTDKQLLDSIEKFDADEMAYIALLNTKQCVNSDVKKQFIDSLKATSTNCEQKIREEIFNTFKAKINALEQKDLGLDNKLKTQNKYEERKDSYNERLECNKDIQTQIKEFKKLVKEFKNLSSMDLTDLEKQLKNAEEKIKQINGNKRSEFIDKWKGKVTGFFANKNDIVSYQDATVDLNGITFEEKEYDFTKVKNLTLQNVDIAKAKKIKFGNNGKSVTFKNVKGLHGSYKLNGIAKFFVYDSDFKDVNNFNAGSGTEYVCFNKVQNLNGKYNLTSVQDILFQDVDLTNVKVKFNPKANKIKLDNVKGLRGKHNFTKVGNYEATGTTDISNAEIITQKEKFLKVDFANIVSKFKDKLKDFKSWSESSVRWELFKNLLKTAGGAALTTTAISTVMKVAALTTGGSGLAIASAAVPVIVSLVKMGYAVKNTRVGITEGTIKPGLTMVASVLGACEFNGIAKILGGLAVTAGGVSGFLKARKIYEGKGLGKTESAIWAVLTLLVASGAGAFAGQKLGELLGGELNGLFNSDGAKDVQTDVSESTEQKNAEPAKSEQTVQEETKPVEQPAKPENTESAKPAEPKQVEPVKPKKSQVPAQKVVVGSEQQAKIDNAERITNKWYANDKTELANRIELIEQANKDYGTDLNPHRAVLLNADAGAKTFDNTQFADGGRSGGIHTIFTKLWAKANNVDYGDVATVKHMYDDGQISKDELEAALRLDKFVNAKNQIGKVFGFSNKTYSR